MTRFFSRIGIFALLLSYASPSADGGEIKQWFPANEPASARKTHWRVIWGVENHGDGSEILFIREAYFQRDPAEPEIKVLEDCRLAEIFVPYHNNTTRIYDISGHQFSLLDLDKTALGPSCITPGTIYNRMGEVAKCGPVAAEVHDGNIRWMNEANVLRRGQGLAVWAVLDASNYRYIMLYHFRDDGVIGFRVGATGRNLFSSDDDTVTHVHMGCWRLNIALGDATKTKVSKVSLKTASIPEKTVVDPILVEGGHLWVPEEFTRLRIESTVTKNKHNPEHFIGYELIPVRMGSGRYAAWNEEFTQNDFWLTVAKPGEISPKRIPSYNGAENLNTGTFTIWHHSAALHLPRDEDFGVMGTTAEEGVAITAWAGCDLKPRNFFASTPLYP